MTLRRIKVLALTVILSVLFLAPGLAQSSGSNPAMRNALPPKWTFEGCWTRFSSGPCRDIYHDDQGNHFICKECGTTGNPGPGKCDPISQATLASGLWCS